MKNVENFEAVSKADLILVIIIVRSNLVCVG